MTYERKYIKVIYNSMLIDLQNNPEVMNWARRVKILLDTMGFSEVWLNQGVANNEYFLQIFKVRSKDCFIQIWNEELRESTRASTYILFSKFSYQSYLDTILNKKFRTALTRLRVSSHRLEIEMGRWHKPHIIPRNERKCQLCNTLEDEFHFILECPLYHDLRIQYIPRYYWRNPNIPKFIELIINENSTRIRKLACFIYKGFEIRQNR